MASQLEVLHEVRERFGLFGLSYNRRSPTLNLRRLFVNTPGGARRKPVSTIPLVVGDRIGLGTEPGKRFKTKQIVRWYGRREVEGEEGVG